MGYVCYCFNITDAVRMSHDSLFSQPVSRSHGGTDQYGVPRDDFSTNSNACGPCPAALAAVSHADARYYPDAGYTVLRQRLADFHAVDVRRVVLAASASEFIFRITAVARQQGGRAVWLPEAHGAVDRAGSDELAIARPGDAGDLIGGALGRGDALQGLGIPDEEVATSRGEARAIGLPGEADHVSRVADQRCDGFATIAVDFQRAGASPNR